MMLRGLLLMPLLTLSLILSACSKQSQDDCGFVQNVYGERISWKGDIPVVMRIHESVPTEFRQALQAAADRWNQTAGREILVLSSDIVTGDIAPQKDGSNIIYYMNTWEANKPSEQARTSVYWIGDQIKEADIRINAANFKFYWNQGGTGVNFEALLIHEMGHVLGLKHKDTSGSVMATYLSNNTDRVSLAATDETSLQCEY